MSQARKRFNRFVPREEVEWLDRDQRAKHRQTIKILTDIAITLEKGEELSPAQEGLIRSATGGSDARDTRLNASWDMLESTEIAYAEKLSRMAPYDLTAYHELINPHEPPSSHHYFLCDHLMKVESGEIQTLIVALPPGAAKKCVKTTQVRCAEGLKSLGDIVVGDRVVTLEGRLKEVLEVIEAPSEQVYAITLEDGTVIGASNDHSWPTDRGHVCTEDLTPDDLILRPRTWEPVVDSSIPLEDVAAEVDRLCAVIAKGSRQNQQILTVAPFIHRLPNGRLRQEFLIPFIDRCMNEYVRENKKSVRRQVSHPSESVINDVWLLLRRVGIDVKKPRYRREDNSTNRIYIHGYAYEQLLNGLAPTTDSSGDSSRNKWEYLIAGLMTGDGSSVGYTCSFHNRDESTVALFRDVMQQDHGIEMLHRLRESGAEAGGEPCHVLVGRTDFTAWLKDRDLHGKNFVQKRVPEWVKKGSETDIAYFLSGCFLTDGTLYARKPNEGHTASSVGFNISHANKELVSDYVGLFAAIGIEARIVDRSTTYRDKSYKYWSVILSRKKDIVRFFNKGFIVGYKKDRFDRYVVEGLLPRAPVADRYAGTRVVSVIATERVEDMRCLRIKDDATFLVNNGHATCNSTYSSRSFAQWFMGRNPDKRVLACAHTQRFGEDEFSKPNRAVLDSDPYRLAFPDVSLNPAEKGASFWRLDGWRGSYAVRGAGAGTSGLRAHLVLADDLYKNAQDALSPTVRDTLWRWWTADVMSRRLPNAPTILVNTRWFSEDVAGKLIAMHERDPTSVPEPFVFINIPAQAEENDPLGRAPGEWLWCVDQQPDGFYTIQDYITKRNSMPPSMWSALYLGQPLDKLGDFISEDEFQRYDRPPINRRNAKIEWTKTVMSIDTAAKGTERSDYTAILTFRVGTDGRHYLVDVWRGKESMEKVIRVMSRLMRLWQVNYAIIEDTGMGVQILENYQGKLPSPLVKYTPSGKGSKDFRFDAAAPWITAGKVLFPTTSPWIHDFINELVAFPNGSNDDQVDAFAQYTDTEFKLRSGGTKPLRMRG